MDMSRVKIIIVGVLAAIALSAITAASASAEAPELGRCVKVSPAVGKYKGEHCTLAATATEHQYEWFPGPGALSYFLIEGVFIHLTRTNGESVLCSPGNIEGHWTGPKTATITVFWWNCDQPQSNGEVEKVCGTGPTVYQNQ